MTKLHWSFLMTAVLFGCGHKEDVDVDAYGDGAFASVDCDDNDASVYPGADELCDGLDNNCDEAIDEDATDAGTFYVDNDGDSYGSGAAVTLCDGSGYVSDNTDCNDSAAAAYPGGAEICDGLDNDCNGTIDDGSDVSMFYNDADGDGYGDAKDSVEACVAPVGYVDNSDDCNDFNDELNPNSRWTQTSTVTALAPSTTSSPAASSPPAISTTTTTATMTALRPSPARSLRTRRPACSMRTATGTATTAPTPASIRAPTASMTTRASTPATSLRI